MAFDGLTLNPGSGGAVLATDSFTDTDSQNRIMPFGAVAFGALNGPYTPVDDAHGLPVQQQAGATWAVSLEAIPLATNAATATLQAAQGAVLESIDARLAGTLTVGTHAVTQSGAWTVGVSGTVPVSGPLTDAQLRASAVPVSLASVPTHAVTQSGAWTFSLSAALPAGTNNIGDVDVLTLPAITIAAAQTLATVTTVGTVTTLTGITNTVTTKDLPVTSGGLLMSHTVSAASTNATSVKAGAGQVYDVQAFNTSASPRYLKLYNKASAPTVGTDTPVKTLLIPGNTAGAGVVKEWAKGLEFTTGIAFAVTTGIGNTDTGAVGAGEVVIGIDYK